MAKKVSDKDTMPMQASEIERELKAFKDVKKFELRDNQCGKSTIWTKFGIVYVSVSGKKTDFAACKVCNKHLFLRKALALAPSQSINASLRQQQKDCISESRNQPLSKSPKVQLQEPISAPQT